MPSSANKIKLGELLIDAGIITSGDLTEAIQVSRRLGVPIGQALLVSRCVTDNVLEAALEAQPLVKDGTISRSTAVDALKKSYEEGTPLRVVLDIQDPGEDSQQTSRRLAELLLDSDIVNQEQLDQALMTSFSSGMPLGSALVLEGVLSPSLFPSILRIQRNIREGKVGRDEGISELKSTFLHWIKAEESLARAAEMEDAAEMYSQEEEDLLAESFAVEDEPVVHVHHAAPAPQPQPQYQHIQVQNVQHIEQQQMPVEVSPPIYGEPPRLVDLLREAGAVNARELQRAFDKVLDDPEQSAKLFMLLGLADEETVQTALRSLSLREKQMLTDDEAVEAVRSVSHHGENGESEISDPKMRRYFDKTWRKSTATKVLGGIAVGAAVAGISSLFKRPRK